MILFGAECVRGWVRLNVCVCLFITYIIYSFENYATSKLGAEYASTDCLYVGTHMCMR